jgi:hypothetical protein
MIIIATIPTTAAASIASLRRRLEAGRGGDCEVTG